MLKNLHGQEINHELAIFPIISFIKNRRVFKCLGTGFFIHPMGWFVTAKHVLLDSKDDLYENLMAVQSLTTGKQA